MLALLAISAVKYEPHVGQSQKKRLLAMAHNECLMQQQQQQQQQTAPQPQVSGSHLHVPKLEPTEYTVVPVLPYSEYPQMQQQQQPQPVLCDKRASWAPAPTHHSGGSSSGGSGGGGGGHHKREPGTAYQQQMAPHQLIQQGQATVPPPLAHSKSSATAIAVTAAAVASWGAPVYRQPPLQSSNTPLGTSPGGLLQPADIYAQQEMYRRPTVFMSQAPYQSYNRVVPPPAHNASNRQVLPSRPLPAHIQFPTQFSQFGPLSPAQVTECFGRVVCEIQNLVAKLQGHVLI